MRALFKAAQCENMFSECMWMIKQQTSLRIPAQWDAKTGPEVIKLFLSCSNSAEHEIFSANEYENNWHFHIY